MAWLISEARVLASIDVAESRTHRAKGLLGKDGIEGAFAIPNCRWVHTMGMRFDLDVAYVDKAGTVIRIDRLKRHRMAMPVAKANMVIEAQAGAFERWGLHVGDPVELRVTDPNAASPSDGNPDPEG